MDRLETRELAYFVAVAEELSFRRAAERLGLAQPPLSRAIKQLERRIGVPLLDRTEQRVALTPAGRVLLVEARKALEAVTAAALRARRAATPGSHLVLAMKPGGDSGLLQDILAEYQEQPGAIPVEVAICGLGGAPGDGSPARTPGPGLRPGARRASDRPGGRLARGQQVARHRGFRPGGGSRRPAKRPRGCDDRVAAASVSERAASASASSATTPTPAINWLIIPNGELDVFRRYQVFLNYPHDRDYRPFADALSFGVVAAGMIPLTALELTTPDTGRLEMLVTTIKSCHYSAHDLSRCHGESAENLARMNMPIEMGMAMFHALSTAHIDHRYASTTSSEPAVQGAQLSTRLNPLTRLAVHVDAALLEDHEDVFGLAAGLSFGA
jgi:hypothetical protein